MSNSQQDGPRPGQAPQASSAHSQQQTAQAGANPGANAAQAPGPIETGKAKRRLRNFLLQPLLQVKIGLYSIFLSLLFAIAVASMLYFNFFPLIETVLKMTDADEEVREFFLEQWRAKQIWVYLTFFIYLLAQISMSVLYTHRLVGPTYAFRRHIRSLAEGRFNSRTYLRKGDAFYEVADELNHLSEVLDRRWNAAIQSAISAHQNQASASGQHSHYGSSGNG